MKKNTGQKDKRVLANLSYKKFRPELAKPLTSIFLFNAEVYSQANGTLNFKGDQGAYNISPPVHFGPYQV